MYKTYLGGSIRTFDNEHHYALTSYIRRQNKKLCNEAESFQDIYKIIEMYKSIDTPYFKLLDVILNIDKLEWVYTSHSRPVNSKYSYVNSDKNYWNNHVREIGWVGKISIKYDKDPKIGIIQDWSRNLYHNAISTGGGGGGHNHMIYEVRIFLKDFPQIYKKFVDFYNLYTLSNLEKMYNNPMDKSLAIGVLQENADVKSFLVNSNVDEALQIINLYHKDQAIIINPNEPITHTNGYIYAEIK